MTTLHAHALRAAFTAGRPAFGAWLTLSGFFHARTVAQASPHLSWVLIDCEHGLVPLNLGAAESVAAIHGAGMGQFGPSALVRIPAPGLAGVSSTGWQIKHALDAGAHGVLVPMVSTAEQAREIVADSRFPPVGRRGLGSPFAHTNWGLNVAGYLKSANDSVVVLVQIETKEGVANVKEIAAVDGIDVLFIGPYDLSASLDHPPPSPDPHPDVEKIIQEILCSVHAAGKKCAIYCSSGTQAAKRAAEGFDMINVVSDMGILSEGIASHLNTAVAR